MIRRFSRDYFSSAWIPSALSLGIFGLLFLNELKLHFGWIGFALLLALVLSLLGVLASGIYQVFKGRKLWGAINLLAIPLIGWVMAMGIGFLFFSMLFNDKPDNFGKDIVIPADMQVSDPVDQFEEPGGSASDQFTENIVAAFSTIGNITNISTISTDLAALNEFATTNRQRLIEHLSASPRWFVTEERGKPYAYRRLVIGRRWQNTLNGYYSSFDVDPSDPHFQMRIIIGFDGPVFVDPFRRNEILTTAQVGTGAVPIRVVDDKRGNQGKESCFLLQSMRASLEIFEQSGIEARPATELAVAEVKRELESALASSNAAHLSPLPDIQTGESVIELAKGTQGGIYQVRAFVNSGEAGRAFLKVFEATQNTPLSSARLQPRSVSRIGWSTNSNEKFRYQSEITVYEGDWGTFYPARFELWFMPDSGKPERKLIDRIFRIEGWQR